MVMLRVYRIGRIPHFIGMCNMKFIRQIGRAMQVICSVSVNSMVHGMHPTL